MFYFGFGTGSWLLVSSTGFLIVFKDQQDAGLRELRGLHDSGAAYIRLFRHLGRHRFFIIFPTPFFIDFGSILAPKMAPKSIKNPPKINPKT